jgi:hypothetical protein
MSTPIPHRAIAVLRVPKQVPALITFARAIVTAMTSNANFPTPTPPLADVGKSIDSLQAAQTQAQARTHGAVATRNQARIALMATLELLKGYVQDVADADREKSAGIIQSATLNVRKVPAPGKRAFAVKPGTVSGSVKLSVPSAGHRSSYDWQQSADGGKTWVDVTSTIQTKTVVAGLLPGTTYSFRFRAVTKTGVGDWSQPLSIIVH